jgi:hypothetical protein
VTHLRRVMLEELQRRNYAKTTVRPLVGAPIQTWCPLHDAHGHGYRRPCARDCHPPSRDEETLGDRRELLRAGPDNFTSAEYGGRSGLTAPRHRHAVP